MASILCSRLNDNLGSIKREATSLVRVNLSVFPLHPCIRNIVQCYSLQEWTVGTRSAQGSRSPVLTRLEIHFVMFYRHCSSRK